MNMQYVVIISNLLFLLLYAKSRKIICKGQQLSKVTLVFYKMGLYLLSFPVFERIVNNELTGRLSILYPLYEKKTLVRHYYAQKLSMVLILLFLGTNMLFLKQIAEQKMSVLQDGYRLVRDDYGKEDTSVVLSITQKDLTTKIIYPLSAIKYKREEVQTQIQTFEEHIETYILGDNESLDLVRTDLELKEAYEGFAFAVEWESDRYSLLDSDGTVGNEALKEPEVVMLTAVMTYEDIEEQMQFPVRIYPREKEEEELKREHYLQAIKEADEIQKTDLIFTLPQTIDGNNVTYQIPATSPNALYLLALFAVAIVIFYARDRDLRERTKKREKELLLVYSEFISQFTLFVNAGMSVRGALVRLSWEKALGQYLTQELKILARDLGNGVLEADAIEAFSKRCALGPYIKFCGLLIQNRKKGNQDLLQQLRQEAMQAFIKRKNDAIKLSEEASTKLLAPMMGMLMVVMIVIILPAFLSFRL